MNKVFAQFCIACSKIQKEHIQLFIILLALTMLVLGAGAPEDTLPH
jgi:hypothetical protein